MSARATVGLTADDHEQMTRYMPPAGPALTRWTRLHTLHVLAMQQQNFYEACKIADAKYQIYLYDSRERTAAWIAEHVG